MRLIELIMDGVPGVANGIAFSEAELAGLTCDSREVEPGYLFAALPGAHSDGRNFIEEAIERGAVAVLAPPGTRVDSGGSSFPLLIDENPRRLFAQLAARFFGRQPETVAAITGTNGKTSVASFLCQMWTQVGRKAASMGTLGIVGPGINVPGSLTTPDPVALHRSLQDLAEHGVERLAMEASSHGLAQCRLDGVRVKGAAFTNLSRDHLDYHETLQAYLDAKIRLFTDILDSGGMAVLNADSPCSAPVQSACQARRIRLVTYGFRGADVRIEHAKPLPDGQRLELTVAGKSHAVTLPLVGTFQAGNALCALALAAVCGEDCDKLVAILETLKGAPGRVQRVACLDNGATVYVDYAHTPDALANVLRALRPHTRGRLAVVFGCGGDRDPGKRPEMGRLAAELADRCIVTDDNPRTEDAAAIRRQVVEGCPAAHEIGDRAQAIAVAIDGLEADDLLVVAGKGHEAGQVVGNEVRPFDDAQVVRSLVGEGGA